MPEALGWLDAGSSSPGIPSTALDGARFCGDELASGCDCPVRYRTGVTIPLAPAGTRGRETYPAPDLLSERREEEDAM